MRNLNLILNDEFIKATKNLGQYFKMKFFCNVLNFINRRRLAQALHRDFPGRRCKNLAGRLRFEIFSFSS